MGQRGEAGGPRYKSLRSERYSDMEGKMFEGNAIALDMFEPQREILSSGSIGMSPGEAKRKSRIQCGIICLSRKQFNDRFLSSSF